VLRRVTLVLLVVGSLPAVATAGAPVPSATASSPAASDSSAVAAVTGGSAFDPDARSASATVATSSASTAGTTGSAADETIERTIELHLTPDEPGTIRAVVTYRVPESVSNLEASIGPQSTVTATDGFEQSGTDAYEWTESTTTPSLTLRVDANQTATGRRHVDAAATSGEHVFLDPGPWALTQVPRVGTRWRWTGTGDVTLSKRTTVAGEGATGGEMAYFGPVTRYEATGRDERFELVVPDRASLNATPSSVLGSLVAASERLRVGERSDVVTVIAAPGSERWGVAGLQFGDDDAWVTADAPVNSPDNVWLHEYVHTRQRFETTDSGQWATEATADYYAALLTHEQGNVSYDRFREHLARGQRDRYSDDVLAFPRTWSGGANYLKGALAVGGMDLRMREATERTATFQSVFRALNEYNGSVSNDEVLTAVADAAGSDAREYAASVTRTDRTAETWSEATHARSFGELPAVFEYRIVEGGLTASGVYGDRTLGTETVTVAAGETLAVDLRVENVGWERGEYRTSLAVDGAVVANRSGTLDAAASTTETFQRTFADPGTYEVVVGGRTLAVEVVERPTPTVESVDAPESVAVGEDVGFTVSVRNDAAVPGRVALPIAVDGEVLSNETLLVPAGSSATRTYSTSFSEPGEHTIRVGETTVTVSVTGGDGATDGGGTATEPLPVPGFGAALALGALAVVSAVAARRRE